MKLAWLCYDQFGDIVIKFEEPDRRMNSYWKIVPIVWTEIVDFPVA